jgi:hypothetical protein
MLRSLNPSIVFVVVDAFAVAFLKFSTTWSICQILYNERMVLNCYYLSRNSVGENLKKQLRETDQDVFPNLNVIEHYSLLFL